MSSIIHMVMSNSAQSTEEAVRSNWWYVVGFVALWAPISTVLFALYLLSFKSVGSIIVPLAYLAIIMLLLLPVALYFDIRAVNRSCGDWSPNVALYVGAATIGIVATILSFVVAVVYLYRRHRYVGIP